MTTISDRIRVRTFIDGVLFPYVSEISVTNTPSSVSAMITIPYSPVIREEEIKGAMIHIFYGNNRIFELFGENPGELATSNWPILFQGELSGITQGGSLGHRNLSFQCVGHGRHLAQAQMYFYDPKRNASLEANTIAGFLGTKTVKFETSSAVNTTARLKASLSYALDQANENDTDRYAAYTATIHSVIADACETHSFLRYINGRLKLQNRFAAFVDPDVKKILPLSLFTDYVDRRFAALPDTTSVQTLLDVLTSTIRYNWVHIGQPSLNKPNKELVTRAKPKDDLLESGNRILNDRQDALGFDALGLERLVNEANAASLEQDSRDALSIAVSSAVVELESGIERLRRDAATIPTQSSSFVIELTRLGLVKITRDALVKDKGRTLTYMGRKPFIGAVLNTMTYLDTNTRIVDAIQFILDQEAWPIAPKPDDGKEDKSAVSLEAIRNHAKDTVGKDENLDIMIAKASRLEELNEFVMVPEMTFSQPPRCNVFTPDVMDAWNISVNHFEEITRLLGRVRFTPKDSLVELYVAPSSEAFFRTNADGSITLLDEEFVKATTQFLDKVEDIPNQED